MIKNDPLKIDEDPFLSDTSKQLLIELLEKDPAKRLGCGKTGATAVKQHPFFAGLDWDAMYKKLYKPPLIPEYDIAEEAKLKYTDEGELIVGKKKKNDRRFKGFSYVGTQYTEKLREAGLCKGGSPTSPIKSTYNTSGKVKKTKK